MQVRHEPAARRGRATRCRAASASPGARLADALEQVRRSCRTASAAGRWPGTTIVRITSASLSTLTHALPRRPLTSTKPALTDEADHERGLEPDLAVGDRVDDEAHALDLQLDVGQQRDRGHDRDHRAEARRPEAVGDDVGDRRSGRGAWRSPTPSARTGRPSRSPWPCSRRGRGSARRSRRPSRRRRGRRSSCSTRRRAGPRSASRRTSGRRPTTRSRSASRPRTAGDAEADRADHRHREDRDRDLGVSRHRCASGSSRGKIRVLRAASQIASGLRITPSSAQKNRNGRPRITGLDAVRERERDHEQQERDDQPQQRAAASMWLIMRPPAGRR